MADAPPGQFHSLCFLWSRCTLGTGAGSTRLEDLATSSGVWAHVGTWEGPEVWLQGQLLRVPEAGLAPAAGP